MWQLISDYDKKAQIQSITDRLQVPGGWIVRTMTSTFPGDGGSFVAQTFVSDPGHEWNLK